MFNRNLWAIVSSTPCWKTSAGVWSSPSPSSTRGGSAWSNTWPNCTTIAWSSHPSYSRYLHLTESSRQLLNGYLPIEVLYTLITFGVSYDPSVESELDQPDHLLRLRLVLTILDTCGVFFSSGLSKKRLDYYLHYLQVLSRSLCLVVVVS